MIDDFTMSIVVYGDNPRKYWIRKCYAVLARIDIVFKLFPFNRTATLWS